MENLKFTDVGGDKRLFYKCDANGNIIYSKLERIGFDFLPMEINDEDHYYETCEQEYDSENRIIKS